MKEPFVKIDLHGLRQEEAIKVIDKATSLRSMIYDWYQYEPKVKWIMPGDNPGITVLVLKELY